jgi:hypothetical protein
MTDNTTDTQLTLFDSPEGPDDDTPREKFSVVPMPQYVVFHAETEKLASVLNKITAEELQLVNIFQEDRPDGYWYTVVALSIPKELMHRGPMPPNGPAPRLIQPAPAGTFDK